MKGDFDQKAVGDLEGALHELVNMAGIVDDLSDALFSERPADGETYRFPREQIDQFQFAAVHMKKMLKDFRSGYFSAVGLIGD